MPVPARVVHREVVLWWGVQDQPQLALSPVALLHAACFMLRWGLSNVEKQSNTWAGGIPLEGFLASKVGRVEVQSRTLGRALSAQTSGQQVLLSGPLLQAAVNSVPFISAATALLAW